MKQLYEQQFISEVHGDTKGQQLHFGAEVLPGCEEPSIGEWLCHLQLWRPLCCGWTSSLCEGKDNSKLRVISALKLYSCATL